MTGPCDLLIGTYTEGAGAHGEGIYRCDFDASNGQLGAPQLLAALHNPSYLAVHPTLPSVLYAVEERADTDAPALVRLRLAPGGEAIAQRCPLTGAGACHLAVSPDGRYLATAQYQTGHVDLFHLRGNGEIGAHLSTFRTEGSGPNARRQDGPHAHCVLFLSNPQALVLADLGRDCVTLFALGPGLCRLDRTQRQEVAFPPGSGPRHIAAINRGAQLAVLCELDETLAIMTPDAKGWRITGSTRVFLALQSDGSAAAIRSGQNGVLYASGRTAHEVACATIAPGGSPQVIQQLPTGGDHPRDILLSPDERHLFVANQHSNAITVFAVAPDGTLTPTPQRIEIGSPACLIWSRAPSGDHP